MNYPLPQSLRSIAITRNRHTEAAQRHTRQWTIKQGLEHSEHTAHQLDIYLPGTYAGYMWPQASRNDLFILSDLTGWFSCQDDIADEDLSEDPVALEALLHEVHRTAFGRGTKAVEALGAGLADIVRRSGKRMPEQWKQRTAEQYASYLFPCVTAAIHRLQKTQPGAEEYESVWRNAGGFQVCHEFTYFERNVHLPSFLYYSAAWQEIRLLNLNLLKAVNDLLSFSIMENPDEDIYNLLTHLRHSRGYSPDQAASEVSRRLEEWAERFERAQLELPRALDQLKCDDTVHEQALRCAEAFKLQWHGNIGWHLEAPRYREIRFQSQEGSLNEASTQYSD